MQDKLENLVKVIYRKWKAAQPRRKLIHPDEEALACFLENRLSPEQSQEVKAHLLCCASCAEVVAAQISLKDIETKDVPPELLERLKGFLPWEGQARLLEIWLKVKEKTLEIINTTGDVLVGQELVPAPVLRSRSIKEFKDEVTILKDFQNIRIQVKVENKGSGVFNLNISAKGKQTQEVIKDLRITLIKDDLELESYLTDSGSVTFEHLLLGQYKLEVTNIEEKVASILLDIKV